MKILIINGPNLNMLGIREPGIYGKQNYSTLVKMIEDTASSLEVEVSVYQSNHEGCLVDEIQKAYGKIDGIVINPAAYTHTSVAIPDALKAVGIPTVEVHISDINQREEFRRHSFTSPACKLTIAGHGFDGYLEAMEYLVNNYSPEK